MKKSTATPKGYCEIDERPYTASLPNRPTSPAPRLGSIDRRQILLRTVEVEKLIDADHSARFVCHAPKPAAVPREVWITKPLNLEIKAQ